jgi:hypothetical protein
MELLAVTVAAKENLERENIRSGFLNRATDGSFQGPYGCATRIDRRGDIF